MSHNPIAWFEIYVNDLNRAQAFYQAVFAVELTPMPNPDASQFPDLQMLAFPSDPESYGAGGALVKMPGFGPGGGTIVYFASQDCAQEAARAQANGGTIIRGKTAIGEHGFIALITDTEGNTIGIYSMA